MKEKIIQVLCANYKLASPKIGDKFKVVDECCCAYSVHIFKPITIEKGHEFTCSSITQNLYGTYICGYYNGQHVEIDPKHLLPIPKTNQPD